MLLLESVCINIFRALCVSQNCNLKCPHLRPIVGIAKMCQLRDRCSLLSMANINLLPSPSPNPNQRYICHVLTLMDWRFKDLIRFRARIKI